MARHRRREIVPKLLLPGPASSARSLARGWMSPVARVLPSTTPKILIGELVYETVGRIVVSVTPLTLLIRWLWALDVLLLVRALILVLLLLLAVVGLIGIIHEVPRAACITIGSLQVRTDIFLTDLCSLTRLIAEDRLWKCRRRCGIGSLVCRRVRTLIETAKVEVETIVWIHVFHGLRYDLGAQAGSVSTRGRMGSRRAYGGV